MRACLCGDGGRRARNESDGCMVSFRAVEVSEII